jgi:predicted alpha/beta-fold hydrolase
MTQFIPATGLSNKHLQSILSSIGPRRLLEKQRSKPLLRCSQSKIITTPQGVKLLGYLSKTNKQSKGIAIILHGWEGSVDSLYVLSCGQKLLEQGFDVFRLNFRDHGESHHLNKDLFNSSRLQEITEAVKAICYHYGGEHNILCGYSLGGNFCLRVANLAVSENIKIHQAIAVSPLLHPQTTMLRLNRGLPIYEKYFVRKWKRSLIKKLNYYPEYDYAEVLSELKTLDDMNDYFVDSQTEFNSTQDYFDAYSIIGNRLNKISIPTSIITSKDDPMIPSSELSSLYTSKWLTIELQNHGGHCAFIKNWKFESWVSDRIVQLVITEEKLKID